MVYFQRMAVKLYHVCVHPLLGVVPLCLYGLWLRARWRWNTPFWVDETWQIGNVNRGFLDMIRIMPEQEYCSYLSGDNLLVYPFVQIFGPDSRWGIAIPHILSALVGFVLLYMICRKMFRTPWAFWAAFAILTVNNTMVLHAFEIRTYAVLPTLALAAFYVTMQMIRNSADWTRKQWIGAGLFSVLTIWFHVYGIAMLFFCTVFWLGTRWKSPDFAPLFKRVALFYLPVLVVAMPLWIVSVFGPHFEHGWRDVFQFIPHPFDQPVGFIKGIVGNLIGNEVFYIFYPVVLCSMLLPHKDRNNQIALALLLIVLPILLILLSDLQKQYWFIQRQFIWCIPYMAVLIGWSVQSCLAWAAGETGEAEDTKA